jgi:hypothetical protein
LPTTRLFILLFKVSSNNDNLIWNNKNFPNKTTEDEDIILLVREDIVVLIFRAVGLYLLFFILLLLRVFASGFGDLIWISLYDTILFGVGAILTVAFLIIFHNYYLSLQIVTSERIIDIDQTNLFRREVSSTTIDKIEDVTHKKENVLNLLFNYGDVIIQTAGRSGNEAGEGIGGFVFNNVPNPEEIAHMIDTLQQAEERGDSIRNAKLQAEAIQKALNNKILQ